MFDIKKEVPSLELCKKLKELGYPQEGGGWYWVKDFIPNEEWLLMYVEEYIPEKESGHWGYSVFEPSHNMIGFMENLDRIKAPTNEELGKWLPERIETSDDTYSLVIEKYDDGWTVEYKSYNPYSIEPFDSLIIISADTLSYTMGLMLEWLVENGYVNFKKGGEDEQT